MSAWLIWGVILGGYLLSYRVTYTFFRNDDLSGSDDAMGRALTVTLALAVSLLWPFVLLGWLVWRFATPRTAADRRQELDDLERRAAVAESQLRNAERELGINMPPLPPREPR